MANPIRKKAIAGIAEGDVFSYARTFTRMETVQFGDMTHDYNPVHYDEDLAKQSILQRASH